MMAKPSLVTSSVMGSVESIIAIYLAFGIPGEGRTTGGQGVQYSTYEATCKRARAVVIWLVSKVDVGHGLYSRLGVYRWSRRSGEGVKILMPAWGIKLPPWPSQGLGELARNAER